MPRTCILTDSTAYFTKPEFAGNEHISILPHWVQVDGRYLSDGLDLTLFRSPSTHFHPPLAIPPSIEAFENAYISLGREYKEIIVILLSSHLSPTITNAQAAVEACKTPAEIFIIDSMSTAIGLGLLVQAAAELCRRGYSGHEINRLVRGMVSHIYTVFCLPDLSYLHRSGLIEPAQAVVGEMLGIIPFFTLENGRLVHTQKIRSPRHLVDIMYEFVAEFENLKYLALIQGISSFDQERKNLHDRLSQNIRSTPLVEHGLSLALATILGPRCMGLVAMENTTKES